MHPKPLEILQFGSKQEKESTKQLSRCCAENPRSHQLRWTSLLVRAGDEFSSSLQDEGLFLEKGNRQRYSNHMRDRMFSLMVM